RGKSRTWRNWKKSSSRNMSARSSAITGRQSMWLFPIATRVQMEMEGDDRSASRIADAGSVHLPHHARVPDRLHPGRHGHRLRFLCLLRSDPNVAGLSSRTGARSFLDRTDPGLV